MFCYGIKRKSVKFPLNVILHMNKLVLSVILPYKIYLHTFSLLNLQNVVSKMISRSKKSLVACGVTCSTDEIKKSVINQCIKLSQKSGVLDKSLHRWSLITTFKI